MAIDSMLDIILGVFSIADAMKRKFTEGREYRKRRFGLFRGELYYWLGMLDTETVQRYHLQINLWTAKEAMEWKESIKSRCEAVSVAAAIFASIGLTALQLEGMQSVHWSATALVTMSMVLGIFSVTAATTLQNTVTRLSNHKDVRLWLSRGINMDWINYPGAFQGLPLESSAATVKLTQAPTLLLNLAVLTFFLGFGLYIIYGWLESIEGASPRFRNQFIFYIITIGVVVGYMCFFWAGQMIDQEQVNQQFNIKRYLDTTKTSQQERLLCKWTYVIEALAIAETEEERDKARRDMEKVVSEMRERRYDWSDEKESPEALVGTRSQEEVPKSAKEAVP